MRDDLGDVISTESVESMLMPLGNQMVLVDSDVARLYGVKTKEVNQAVRNNPRKFPAGYVVDLGEYDEVLRSKILTAKLNAKSRVLPKVFTERGLYMLATILKGERAERASLAIVDTYAKVREMTRTMEALQCAKDGGDEQHTLLRKTGELLADIVGRNLSTKSSETEIELNFAVVKIRRRYFSGNAEGCCK